MNAINGHTSANRCSGAGEHDDRVGVCAPSPWRDHFAGHRKVAIVGTAESASKAPYDDPSWKIWAINDEAASGFCHRWDACFDVHQHDFAAEFPVYWQWLQKRHGKPIVMARALPEVPDSIALPIDEMVEAFGDYITNTVSHTLAVAMLLGVEEIGLWGVNMASDTEYGGQRPSCEFFLGIAAEKEIKITIPEESDLLKTAAIYGIQRPSRMHVKWSDRMDAYRKEEQQIIGEIDRLTRRLCEVRGGMNDMRYWRQWL